MFFFTLLFLIQSTHEETISFTTSTTNTKLSGINFEAPYYGTACTLSDYIDSNNKNYTWFSLMAIDEIEINIYDNNVNQYNSSNNQIGQQLPFIIKTQTSLGLPAISQCTSNTNFDIILCYNVQSSPLPTVYCNIFDNKASKWSANITISPTDSNSKNAAFSPIVLCTNNGYIVMYEYVGNYSMFSNKLTTEIYYAIIQFDGTVTKYAPLLTPDKSNISSLIYNPQQYLFATNVQLSTDNSSSFFVLQTTEFETYGIVGSVKQDTVTVLDTFDIIDKTIGFSLYNNPLALKVSNDCCFIVAYGADVTSPVFFNVYGFSGELINGMNSVKVTDNAYSYSLVELNMLNNNQNGDMYFVVLYVTKDISTGSAINVIDNSVWKIGYDSTNKIYKLNNVSSTPLSIQSQPANYTSYTITPCVNVVNSELFVVSTTAQYNQYTPQPIFGQTFTVTLK